MMMGCADCLAHVPGIVRYARSDDRRAQSKESRLSCGWDLRAQRPVCELCRSVERRAEEQATHELLGRCISRAWAKLGECIKHARKAGCLRLTELAAEMSLYPHGAGRPLRAKRIIPISVRASAPQASIGRQTARRMGDRRSATGARYLRRSRHRPAASPPARSG